ncbi:MAG TPA: hypothetical protein VGQ44_17965 [Gemmatimonadaceae bacterium]|jgi:hypothetical protein|nr:hypothetical protein [Gemmatimonadaceae bacterium]
MLASKPGFRLEYQVLVQPAKLDTDSADLEQRSRRVLLLSAGLSFNSAASALNSWSISRVADWRKAATPVPADIAKAFRVVIS